MSFTIRQNFPIYSRVLFLWNSIPYTGTVMTVGKESYGIKCDSDIYNTDVNLIPRDGDLIFVKKSNCMKTGEITPIIYRNGDIYDKEKFPTVATAFYRLPKKTIYPVLAGDKREFIKLIPGNFIISCKNGKAYRYVNIAKNLVSLVHVTNPYERKTPNWLFQEGITRQEPNENTIDEFDIEFIHEIPEAYIGFDYITLVDRNFLNKVYSTRTHDNVEITKFVRTRKDVDFDNLPEHILYDFNIHTK